MANINATTARAFLRLRAPELQPVVDWLRDVHLKAMEDCSTTGLPDVWRKQQGRAALAKEILAIVESSDELVSKIEGRPQPML